MITWRHFGKPEIVAVINNPILRASLQIMQLLRGRTTQGDQRTITLRHSPHVCTMWSTIWERLEGREEEDCNLYQPPHDTKTVGAVLGLGHQWQMTPHPLHRLARGFLQGKRYVILSSTVLFQAIAFQQTVLPPYRALTLCTIARKSSKMTDFSKTKSRNMAETCVSPLLRQLHWLKAPERIQYKLAVLVYKCRNGMAPSYLADEFLQPADLTTRTRLRSASSLFIRRTRLSTVGNRAFPVAAARVWNSLPRLVTSTPSLSVYCSRLKSHLFKQSFP